MRANERRKNARVPLVVAVKHLKNRSPVLCQSCDLSTLGMALVLPHGSCLPDDRSTRLEFALPGSNRTMAVEVIPVRQKMRGRFIVAGVMFKKVKAEALRKIEEYVELSAA